MHNGGTRQKSNSIYLSAAPNFDKTNSHAILPGGWQAKALTDLDALKNKSLENIEKAALEEK